MKANLKRFKIEKCCSDSVRRPATNSVMLDIEGSCLVATNGVTLAVVPVEQLAYDDAGGLLPLDAIQLSRKDQQKGESAELVANGRASVRVGGARADFDRPTWEGFPDWRTAFRWTKQKPVISISISPRRLLELSEAIGNSNGVTLDIFGSTQAIRVRPMHVDGAKGILMPISYKDEQDEVAAA